MGVADPDDILELAMTDCMLDDPEITPEDLEVAEIVPKMDWEGLLADVADPEDIFELAEVVAEILVVGIVE